MINTNLLSSRNIIAITILATLSHIIARPLYNMIDKKDNEENG